jgi:hypothetical protein
MDKCIDKRGRDYLADIFTQISNAMGCDCPKSAISLVQEMMKEMSLNNPESQNRDEDLKVLSTSVNAIRLKNNPIEIDIKAAKILYSSILL